MAKPVPIQPGPLHNGVMIAPNLQGGRKISSSGLTIRTSRHWVLPPRPKPGRKPSCTGGCGRGPRESTTTSGGTSGTVAQVSQAVSTSSATGAGSVEHGKSATITTAAKPVKAMNATNAMCPAVQGDKKKSSQKHTKVVLRKEIQQLKQENTKLKKELGRLLDSLQDLKRKCETEQEGEPKCDATAEEPLNKIGNDILCVAAEACSLLPESSRKRSHVDDTTDAFLKFEDDDNEETDVSVPPPLTVVRMAHALSFGSRTSLTDDEEVGSTPSSLFSSDFQSYSSMPSLTTATLTPGPFSHNVAPSPTVYATYPHSSPSSTSSSLSKPTTNSTATAATAPWDVFPCSMSFLDNYERQEFYKKHAETIMGGAELKHNISLDSHIHAAAAPSANEPIAPLHSIREEDDLLHLLRDSHLGPSDYKFNSEVQEDIDGTSILHFLKTHITPNPSDLLEKDDNDSWVRDGCAPGCAGSFVAPSLEELLEEQEDGDRDSKLTGIELSDMDYP